MSRRAQKRTATELFELGFSHQQVFDQVLKEHPEAKPKRVAEMVRQMPTIFAKERFAQQHRLLLGLILLSSALRLVHAQFDTNDWHWINGLRLFTLVPIATVLVGYGIYRWNGEILKWVGLGNLLGGLGLLRHLDDLFSGDLDPWRPIFEVLSLAIGILAYYLYKQVFPKYRLEKDISGQPVRVTFDPEPALQRM
ncbi:MAG: hypothetical protein ACO1NQ_13315 [Flavobacteriales bacterium]